MTTLYQYLSELPELGGRMFLGRVDVVPQEAYCIVEEDSDVLVTPYFNSGGAEINSSSRLTVSVNLFGAAESDFTELVPIYQKIKREVVDLVDDHPGLLFRGISVDVGNMRPAYNSEIDRAYGVVRFNVLYQE